MNTNRGKAAHAAALFCAVALGLLAAQPTRAQTEIQFWHAMANELGRQVDKLAADFNASQSDYRIVPVYKGQYAETMTGALFAIRANAQPAIVQVNEIATATMMAAKGATYPVYQLMREQGEVFDPKAYLPAVSAYYADASGNLLSFPFNASTPILYYNKDQFRVASSIPTRRRARGRRSRRRRGNCAPRVCRAASPPRGRHGSTSRTSRPCTTCRSRPDRTASTGLTPHWRSTAMSW